MTLKEVFAEFVKENKEILKNGLKPKEFRIFFKDWARNNFDDEDSHNIIKEFNLLDSRKQRMMYSINNLKIEGCCGNAIYRLVGE